MNATVGFIAYKTGYTKKIFQPAFYASGIRIPKRIVTDFCVIDTNGDIWIAKGYSWNGASGPTIDSKKTECLSLFHDLWYQLIRLGYLPESYRKKGDQMLYKLGRRDGMWKIRIWYWYQGVRWQGGKSAQVGAEPKLVFAPAKPEFNDANYKPLPPELLNAA